MTLVHDIEDLNGIDYKVAFEFHKELDGQIVFDGAWTVLDQSEELAMPSLVDFVIGNWLKNGGEEQIYRHAEREYSYA